MKTKAHAPTFTTVSETEANRRLNELFTAIGALGATNINEMDMTAWRADMMAYRKHGEPLTGAEYRREPNGVRARNALTLRAKLTENGDARWTDDGHWAAQRGANFKVFGTHTPERARAVIQDAIRATDTWPAPRPLVESLEPGTPIPYEAVFLADLVITEADIRTAREWARNQESNGGADQ